jgi:NAD(P)-dependent dehydrogenase (short-subunit alcohol dehydrogenase family)
MPKNRLLYPTSNLVNLDVALTANYGVSLQGRVGRPEDIAEACLHLAEQAGFVTGQNLSIDGGMTVKMIYED